MPILTPDTSNILGNIPAGTYPADITSCEAAQSKKGNNMIVPTFSITVDGKQYTRKAWVVVEGPGAFNFDQLLRAVGQVELADRYRAGEKVPFDTDTLVGQHLNVVVDTEIRDNQERDVIKSYLRA